MVIAMRTMELGRTGLCVPVIGVGCMRLPELSKDEARRFIFSAIEQGANFFDHADIYGRGEAERLFGEVADTTPSLREKMILQSKCGIVPGERFDFSKEHILSSVDGSLQRLRTEYLDVLLLHRPDALMEPEEVAEAFRILKASGKVRHFGVSNQNPGQMRLLQKYMDMPIAADQLQLSIAHANMISRGICVNMENQWAADRDGDVLNFCRLEDITIQPWSPFQHGFFKGTFIGNPEFAELNRCLDEIGGEYGVSATTIAMAWLLRHPAGFQPITGTMKTGRLTECLKAAEITITRQQWYDIYKSAGNILP